MRALILLLAVAGQNPFDQLPPSAPISQTGQGIVQGTVKRTDTGEPISNVTITLQNFVTGPGPEQLTATERRRELTAITDSAGRFSFGKLPEGFYSINAYREDYFGLKHADGYFNNLAVTGDAIDKNRKTATVTLTLIPGGAVSGSVLDSNKVPVPRLWVSALRLTYENGERVLKRVKDVQADDQGRYRLWGLSPGDYYLRVDRAAGCGEAQSAMASSYFPGVPEPEGASVIKIVGGSEMALDLLTLPSSTHKISGRILNTLPEQVESAHILLVPHDSSSKIDEGKWPGVQICFGRMFDGEFEIPVSRPGLYDVTSLTRFERRPESLTDKYYLTGRTTVNVGDKDVTGVILPVERGADVLVRVNSGAVAMKTLKDFRIGLRPLQTRVSTASEPYEIGPPLAQDGSTRFLSVPQGTYALKSFYLPEGVYVADIRQGPLSIYDTGKVVVGKTGAEPVEVVLATGGGKIQGSIDAPNSKLILSRISLIPQGVRRENSSLIKTVFDGGAFTIADIPPGEYKLYAWEELLPGADANEEFMSRYETRGRSVTVKAGSVLTNIKLPLIETERR